jgi:hypothetical protein
MADMEQTAILLAIFLVSVHSFAIIGSEQILETDYTNVGFTFLPPGAQTTDLNASQFELFQQTTESSITALDILITPFKIVLDLGDMALTIMLQALEFFVNLPIYSFVLLTEIGLPSYLIWPILVVIFAIEVFGIMTLFLRFLASIAGVVK